jgi:hypothetical protein
MLQSKPHRLPAPLSWSLLLRRLPRLPSPPRPRLPRQPLRRHQRALHQRRQAHQHRAASFRCLANRQISWLRHPLRRSPASLRSALSSLAHPLPPLHRLRHRLLSRSYLHPLSQRRLSSQNLRLQLHLLPQKRSPQRRPRLQQSLRPRRQSQSQPLPRPLKQPPLQKPQPRLQPQTQ